MALPEVEPSVINVLNELSPLTCLIYALLKGTVHVVPVGKITEGRNFQSCQETSELNSHLLSEQFSRLIAVYVLIVPHFT